MSLSDSSIAKGGSASVPHTPILKEARERSRLKGPGKTALGKAGR